MKYRFFEPLNRELSIPVLGTVLYEHAPLDVSTELLDAWVGLGGNAVDTGRQYGNSEPIIGRWLKERGLHHDVTVISKGGHYDEETGRPRVTALDLSTDLTGSRMALGLDSIDLYLLHRDDPTRSVSAIFEDIGPLTQNGHAQALGASNWTTDRLDEAAVYAHEHSLSPFTCSSPNLSLAVANEEPWPGCVSIHDDLALAWYRRTQLPVLAWQSLAGGFFAGVSDSDVDRVYLSDANLERRRRARSLASERGCTPSQVALAWVLHQPFPVYPIIGPRTVPELRDCVDTLELQLSRDELRWLDLGDAA